jgi:hypothetical protein
VSIWSTNRTPLRICDVNGRTVASLPPAQFVSWHGLDDSGCPVRPGVYLLAPVDDRSPVKTKLVITR